MDGCMDGRIGGWVGGGWLVGGWVQQHQPQHHRLLTSRQQKPPRLSRRRLRASVALCSSDTRLSSLTAASLGLAPDSTALDAAVCAAAAAAKGKPLCSAAADAASPALVAPAAVTPASAAPAAPNCTASVAALAAAVAGSGERCATIQGCLSSGLGLPYACEKHSNMHT